MKTKNLDDVLVYRKALAAADEVSALFLGHQVVLVLKSRRGLDKSRIDRWPTTTAERADPPLSLAGISRKPPGSGSPDGDNAID